LEVDGLVWGGGVVELERREWRAHGRSYVRENDTMIYGSFSSVVKVEDFDGRYGARQALCLAKTAAREWKGRVTVGELVTRKAAEGVD
jgi:hypothetical protein